MNLAITVTAGAALLGCALLGGIFFAFSSFVMKALARVPSQEGIAAMQSINIVVLNPSFLGVFIGTAVISALVAALAVKGWDTPSAPCFLAGALLYLIGTVLTTGLGNVPLNERLAMVTAGDPAALMFWEHYLDRWTLLNTLRTVAAMIAALLFTIGLIQR